MFAFVAVLVIVVAVLLCNDFHFEFSCHEVIIPYFLVWRKGCVLSHNLCNIKDGFLPSKKVGSILNLILLKIRRTYLCHIVQVNT